MNSSYNELATEVDYYRSLFQLIHIHPLLNGGITWRIGESGKFEQIQFDSTGKTSIKCVSPKELAILTIAFCEGNAYSSEQRLIDQDRLMEAGIVTVDDITMSTKTILKNIRIEHLTSDSFLINGVENAAKIAIAKNAYDSLAQYFCEDPERLDDPEAIILLAYIIAIIGYRFELRPYMLNPGLINVDWVSIYDSMFSNFSDINKQFFVDAGYYVLWDAIKKIRDDIYNQKEAKRQKNALFERIGSGRNVTRILYNIFAQCSPGLPPPISSHK